ncbi:MAG: hypothetical protein ACSI46_22860 [Gloeotrichia echinulata DVL01]
MGIGDWGHFGKLSASLGTGDWGLGIGLIYSLLITHYSLLITPYSLLLGIGDTSASSVHRWGLGIGLIYSLLITHYSLLLTIGDWGLHFGSAQ